jgi:hypothetical protein
VVVVVVGVGCAVALATGGLVAIIRLLRKPLGFCALRWAMCFSYVSVSMVAQKKHTQAALASSYKDCHCSGAQLHVSVACW